MAVLAGLTASLTAGAAQAGSAGDARQPSWRITATPNPSKAQISVLASVACPARQACTAVGSSAASLASSTKLLAERWNGKRWRIQPDPTPKGASDVLFGLACPSANDCMAVGNAFGTATRRTTTLTEMWNGKRWRILRTPTTKSPGALYAVSCTSSSSCIAVGHNLTRPERAIAERWNGRTWHMQTLPDSGKRDELSGISCPAAHTCTAVGTREDSKDNPLPLAEVWNGKRWRVQTVPLPNGATAAMFDAVSCTSSRGCTATGTGLSESSPVLAERWNGSTWRVQHVPLPPYYGSSSSELMLNSVSCSSGRSCTATGSYSPNGSAYFVESWNGSQWRLDTVPLPDGFKRGSLLGVSCRSGRCMAVGGYTGKVRIQVSLAMTNEG